MELGNATYYYLLYYILQLRTTYYNSYYISQFILQIIVLEIDKLRCALLPDCPQLKFLHEDLNLDDNLLACSMVTLGYL
jgi:hypothetical protein